MVIHNLHQNQSMAPQESNVVKLRVISGLSMDIHFINYPHGINPRDSVRVTWMLQQGENPCQVLLVLPGLMFV